MEDEIVKTAKSSDYAARAVKAAATRAANAAAARPQPKQKTAAPTRARGAVFDEEEEVARGSRLQSRSGRVEALGRDGETLSRSSFHVTDAFEIPQNMIPNGWSYQWNTISVHGNSEVARDQVNLMQQQGWRPVPAERYAGTLLPKMAKGMVARGGMILEERPLSLTQEAQQEDNLNARRLISDRNESLKLTGVKKGLADGFEMGGKYKGTGGDIRMSIDKALDVPAPAYKLAEPGQ